MSVSDEERRDAKKCGELVRKKLMEIMDLLDAWLTQVRLRTTR